MKIVRTLAFLAALGLSTVTAAAARADSSRPLDILLLSSWFEGMPWQHGFVTGLKRGLTEAGQPVRLFIEYVDASRFPPSIQAAVVSRTLREKYAVRKIDVVIAESVPAVQLLSGIDDVFPGARRIYVQTGSAIRPALAETAISSNVDYRRAFEEIVRMARPDTVFIVGDASSRPAQRRLEQIRSDLLETPGGVPVEFLTHLPADEVYRRIELLPEHSAVFMLPFFETPDGRRVTPKAAAGLIAAAANAPIFTAWDTMLGSGVVGGYMLSSERIGQMAAQRVLGTSKDTVAPSGYYYDWRQLKRWDIDVSRVPDDAELRFYEPTIFEQHQTELLSALAVIVVLLALIVMLARQNRLQAQLRRVMARSNVELEEAVSIRTVELESARVQAEEANRAKSNFLAAMSHELRTPLTAVIGFADLLGSKVGETADPEKVKKFAASIDKSGRHLLALINDLLDFAKIEAGKFTLSNEPFSLREELVNLEAAFELQARENGVSLISQFPHEDCFVDGDALRFRQVVGNLIANAVKFAAGGHVSITSAVFREPDNHVRLQVRVSDDGIGIPADKVDLIFDPFQQSDGSIARRYGGTGLGLPIARNLAKIMGGGLTVESRPGEGSTFSAEFVFRDLTAMRAAIETHRMRAESATAGGLDLGLRVLAVDDVNSNLLVAESMLAEAGCSTHCVADGLSAIAWIRENRVDMILMDMHMPGIDGIETARRIQALENGHGNVPIYAWTADLTNDDMLANSGVRWAGTLNKPTSSETLILAVQRTARAQQPATVSEPVSG